MGVLNPFDCVSMEYVTGRPPSQWDARVLLHVLMGFPAFPKQEQQ